MRTALIVCLALAACGSSSKDTDAGPSRQPGPGEGTTCVLPDGGCPDSLTCASWCAYEDPTGVCRKPCGSSADCLSGESCGTDGTCQCSPAGVAGGSGDSCASLGLTCNPQFKVCQDPQTSTTCPAYTTYSQAWQLCLPSGC